jgi:hypothetical protein
MLSFLKAWMLSFSCVQDVIIFHGVNFIFFEGLDVIISSVENVIIFHGLNFIIFEGWLSVEDVIIFHGLNVIIFEGLDVIILECRGCYHFLWWKYFHF